MPNFLAESWANLGFEIFNYSVSVSVLSDALSPSDSAEGSTSGTISFFLLISAFALFHNYLQIYCFFSLLLLK